MRGVPLANVQSTGHPLAEGEDDRAAESEVEGPVDVGTSQARSTSSSRGLASKPQNLPFFRIANGKPPSHYPKERAIICEVIPDPR